MSEEGLKSVINLLHNIKQQCYNQNCTRYKYYGAVGVGVFNDWRLSSKSFVSWAYDNGFKVGLSLARIDTTSDFSPSNCKWVSRIEYSITNRPSSLTSTNTSGCAGVSFCVSDDRWQVKFLTLEGKRAVRCFRTKELAILFQEERIRNIKNGK